MNSKVFITRGLSGAGKSTWALEYARTHHKAVRISRDDIRFMLYNGDWKEEWEEAVNLARKALTRNYLRWGYEVVLDETYLNPKGIKEINTMLKNIAEFEKLVIDVEIKDFIDVSLEECLANNKPRGVNRFVPEDFMRRYYNIYVTPLLKDPGVTKWTI